jgi:hypothetical protein
MYYVDISWDFYAFPIVSQEMRGDVITHCLECDQEIYQQCECNVILVIALPLCNFHCTIKGKNNYIFSHTLYTQHLTTCMISIGL